MRVVDIAAYLGAAAWAPQIIQMGINFFSRPVITIIPNNTAEIGYTMFGPIFNLHLAINVDKKDTLVDFLGIEICHENGDKQNFEWTGMIEYFSEMRSTNGDNQATFQRETTPISLKLNMVSLTERFFRFRSSMFLKSNNDQKINDLSKRYNYQKNQDQNCHDIFLKSFEVNEYISSIKTGFCWQIGQYIVKFYARSPRKTRLKNMTFKFELTQDDIEALKNNLNEIQPALEAFLGKEDGQKTAKPVRWLWRYPTLTKDK